MGRARLVANCRPSVRRAQSANRVVRAVNPWLISAAVLRIKSLELRCSKKPRQPREPKQQPQAPRRVEGTASLLSSPPTKFGHSLLLLPHSRTLLGEAGSATLTNGTRVAAGTTATVVENASAHTCQGVLSPHKHGTETSTHKEGLTVVEGDTFLSVKRALPATANRHKNLARSSLPPIPRFAARRRTRRHCAPQVSE